jgi:hypothetical protein
MPGAIAMTPNRSAGSSAPDPDLEVLLALLSGVLVPIATVFYQAAVQKGRSDILDARAARNEIEIMRRELENASELLASVERIVKNYGLGLANLTPAGQHGIELTPGWYARYVELVEKTAKALVAVDEAGIRFSSLANPFAAETPWLAEVHNLQVLLSRAQTTDTYGAKVRHLRWAILVAGNVLEKADAAFGTLFGEDRPKWGMA